ncbi:hypothetical protein KP509_36G008500 [Ceratopteris richardii]|uniref:Uncharacterized protein n=1 Tax=Ceratopteris richardii TaxID=49495 RepID=A0A8T2QAC4_CERRI|nr:hypothetical protein KP509_36G008500 [Ceratopteris richardii]
MQYAMPTRSRRPRRNARSLDLDSEPMKAAAWAWHLHEHSNPGGSLTEARFLSSQSQQRSGGAASSDRRNSRFRRESEGAKRPGGSARFTMPIWDCGSSLYDIYEIVSFGDRLERSLMEAVPVPLSEGGVPGLDHGMHSLDKGADQSALNIRRKQGARSDKGSLGRAPRSCVATSRRWSLPAAKNPGRMSWTPAFGKMMKMFKKVFSSRKQAHIDKNISETTASSKRATNRECGVTDLSAAAPGKTITSWEESGYYRSHPEDGKIKSVPNPTRKRAQDDAEPMVISHGSCPPEVAAETTLAAKGRHNHVYHYYHHHHHHHYLPRNRVSESARFSSEKISKLFAE